MKKHVLVSLLMAALLLSVQVASAKTVLVNAAGTDGAYTALADALTATGAGDTIVITDSGTYTAPDWTNLNGRTLRGQVNAPNQAIIKTKFMGVDGTVENLRFEANWGWAMQFRCFNTWKFSRVLVYDKDGADTAAWLVDAQAGTVNQGTWEYCSYYNGKALNGVVLFQPTWGTAATLPSEIGPMTFNHCTFAFLEGYGMFVGPAWPNDGENITVKNSIIGPMTTTDCWVAGIFAANDRTAKPKINHSYNLYTNIWIFEPYGYAVPPTGLKDDGTKPEASLHEIGGGFTWTNPFAFLFSSPGWFTFGRYHAPWEGGMKLDASTGGSYVLTLAKGGPTTQTLNTTDCPFGIPVKPQATVTDSVDFDTDPWTSVSVVFTGTDADDAAQTETVAATADGTKQYWTANATKTFKTLTSAQVTVTPSSVANNDTDKSDSIKVGYAVTAPAKLDQTNMKLMPYYSPALWQADDGLHMGADVTTVPVELSNFEIQ